MPFQLIQHSAYRLAHLSQTSHTLLSSCSLLPIQQQRCASILGSLSDNPGAYSKRIRRGRGPSSGKGKTSGRGHKGQKQHGKVPKGFQGGQTPLEIVHGKRGFENQLSLDMTPINLGTIQRWIDQGRLDPSKLITVKELAQSRCLHGVKDGVKLLAAKADCLRTPINILTSRASAAAIKAVEAVGGSVTTRYYTATSINRILLGKSSPTGNAGRFEYRLPGPSHRKDIEYYRDEAHRGYLSHLVPEGEGPSLFFKTPGKGISDKKKKAKVESANDRLW
ncbi:MAG: YmL10 [Trizodia sp. TS-e1964]|nr:MAG: YmL10 [Trizodia sp. TS-e1964]